MAKPTGFKLRSGEALPPVHDASGRLVVQSGKQALIDWEGFSIGAGEQVLFQQLDGKSYVLNRVMGKEGSELLGSLSSNGAVYLVNPNGVLIGPHAVIETAGFIASTLDLLDEDLSGKEFRFRGESEAGVVNQGVIRCAAGDIFLIGRTVENSGTLNAPQGREGMVSGCDVVIRPRGAPQMVIRAEGEIDQKLVAKNPYALAIRQCGSVEGREVYLVADEGLCEVSGQIVAAQEVGGGRASPRHQRPFA